jgi:hypothetical protein
MDGILDFSWKKVLFLASTAENGIGVKRHSYNSYITR